ncbi:MAG: bile acid:sodium symporter family protein [Planctomycetes bacterium]|nr:bile acid:sodium symporter family protein [Planctomycetota bacterium]
MISKLLSLYTRLFGLWIILAGVVAYFWPHVFDGAAKFNLYFFALTMFGIGAVMTPQDFIPLVRQPWLMLLGTIAEYIIMPFGAFFLAKAFHLSDELAAGLILAGCAPGAMSSNVICYIARADVGYSVALTSVTTLLCPLTTAGLTWLLVGTRLDVSFQKMFFELVWMVIVPLAAGFTFRHFLPRLTKKMEEVFPAISVTFIIFICAIVVAANHDRLMDMTGKILLTVVLLNVGGLYAGHLLGLLFRLGVPQRRTLSIEIGMQNAGLGTVLAIHNFGPRAAVPTALFVYVSIFTAAIMCEYWKRSKARSCQ